MFKISICQITLHTPYPLIDPIASSLPVSKNHRFAIQPKHTSTSIISMA